MQSVAGAAGHPISLLASETDGPDVARRRARWQRHQGRVDPRRLVFVDETWTRTNMAPLRGWGPKGARLRGRAPFGNRNTMTFLAGLRHDRIDAPMLIDGAIDGASFRAWVEQALVPTLRPGDVVVLDNLGVHKAAAVRAAIRAAGAHLLYLPAYSPDLNPIEKVFAKLKQLLRKRARRTRADVLQAIGEILARYTPDKCSNYLVSAGYASVKT
jgi:transposase